MTPSSTKQAEAASQAALEAIEDPKIRAGALAFVSALQSALSGALDQAALLRDDPEAMTQLIKELELRRS